MADELTSPDAVRPLRLKPEDQPTGILRDAAATGDPLAMVRAVAFELRCVADYHQRVTKAEVRAKREFLHRLASNLLFSAASIALPEVRP